MDFILIAVKLILKPLYVGLNEKDFTKYWSVFALLWFSFQFYSITFCPRDAASGPHMLMSIEMFSLAGVNVNSEGKL